MINPAPTVFLSLETWIVVLTKAYLNNSGVASGNTSNNKAIAPLTTAAAAPVLLAIV